MEKGYRMIQIFGYEFDKGCNSILWKQPMYFSHPGGQAGKMLDEEFNNWKTQKRGLK